MIDLVQTVVIVSLTSLSTLGLLAFYMKRTLQQLLTDVGQDIGEQFTGVAQHFGEEIKETFADPNVSRAMSILGKQSGKVRAEAGAEKMLANGILDNMAPELRIIVDRVAPDFIEQYGPEQLLILAQKYGPLLQQFFGGKATQKIAEKFGEF